MSQETPPAILDEAQPATPDEAQAAPAPHPRERAKVLLERLMEAYPLAFRPPGDRSLKPLKLHIHKDLLSVVKDWGFDVPAMKYALGMYTRQLRYQIALLDNPQRVDLQGQPAGEVSEAHRERAREKVELIREKRKQGQEARGETPGKARPRPRPKARPKAGPEARKAAPRKAPPAAEPAADADAGPARGVTEEAIARLQAKLGGKSRR